MSDVKLFRLTNGTIARVRRSRGASQEAFGVSSRASRGHRLTLRFVASEYSTGKNSLLMWLPLNPDEVSLKNGFSADKRNIGHHGTGDLELTIRNIDDLEKAKPLIHKSFEEN